MEIKRTLSSKITRGFTESMTTLRAGRGFIVIPSGDSHPLSETVEAISLRDFIGKIGPH